MDNKHLNFLYFLPILILLLCVNIFVDPASLTSSLYSQEDYWVKEMLNGNIVILKSNFNERKVKQALIKNMPKKNDVIILGPSLIMGVRKKDVGTDSFYNLGESVADIYDILAQLALLEINEVNSKKIIFCIDSLLFDEKSYSENNRHKRLLSYSDYMLNLLYDKPNKSLPKSKDEIFIQLAQYTQNLFSITYFQAGLKYVLTKKTDIKNLDKQIQIIKEPAIYNIKEINGPAYMSDGSYIYSQKMQNNTLIDVQSDVKMLNEVKHNQYHTNGAHMSNFGKETFEKIIQYYTSRGIKIELFLSPYSPSYWNLLVTKNYPIINEEEVYANELTKKYNLSITGSLNPYNVGIKDEDFYDARHIRHEVLSKYFDFKK